MRFAQYMSQFSDALIKFQDANCPLITEMSCSVCTKPQLTCTDPECCTDSDCETGFVCQDQVRLVTRCQQHT